MFENLKKKLTILFIGYDDLEKYEEVKPMIEKYNYRTFVFSTFTFLIVLITLTITSCFVDKMRWMFWGYVFFTFLMLIFFVCSRLDKVKNNRNLVLGLLYFEIFLTLIFGVVVGNFGNNNILAVSYHVLLVVLPLFLCDSPWRIDVLYIIFLFPFLYTSYLFKSHRIFVYDLMNGVIYTILGIFVNTAVEINHFESFNNRCLVKKQYDTDDLTGALTKHAFEHRVQEELRKTNNVGIFMMFDIDNFKSINDTLGHAIGDYFISNTGRIILKHCRQTDIIGRFGGDEFVIFMPGCDSVALIDKKAKEFMTSLKTYFNQTMSYDKFSISIGCTIYNDHSKTYKELFNEIDTALYEAKNKGKDQYCIYKQA